MGSSKPVHPHLGRVMPEFSLRGRG
jgi:hypothetical protein